MRFRLEVWQDVRARYIETWKLLDVGATTSGKPRNNTRSIGKGKGDWLGLWRRARLSDGKLAPYQWCSLLLELFTSYQK